MLTNISLSNRSLTSGSLRKILSSAKNRLSGSGIASTLYEEFSSSGGKAQLGAEFLSTKKAHVNTTTKKALEFSLDKKLYLLYLISNA